MLLCVMLLLGAGPERVMEDYAQRVTGGVRSAGQVAADSLSTLIHKGPDFPRLSHCFNASEVECGAVSEALLGGQSAYITVYNPLGQVRSQVVDLMLPPSLTPAICVEYPNSVLPLVCHVQRTELGLRLTFHASNLPPLGARTYQISTL